MKLQESERTEFKSIVVTDIKKEIIAFANCDGGKIYIGIEDDGTVIGVEDSDSVALQVSNMVRDAIKPHCVCIFNSVLAITEDYLSLSSLLILIISSLAFSM